MDKSEHFSGMTCKPLQQKKEIQSLNRNTIIIMYLLIFTFDNQDGQHSMQTIVTCALTFGQNKNICALM